MKDSKKQKKVLAKIRGLLAKAKAEGASENEIEIFMKKANDLMVKYQIEEGEIEISKSDIDKDIIYSDLWKAFGYKYNNFEWELMDMLGDFYNCRVFHGTHHDFKDVDWRASKKVRLTLIGSRENREMLVEAYEAAVEKFLVLSNTRYKEYQKTKRQEIIDRLKGMGLEVKGLSVKELEKQRLMTRKSTWVGSYLSGAISGLRSALNSQRKETLALPADQEKWGLIVKKMDELINMRMPELMPKYRSVDGIGKKIGFDPNAFEEGEKDGKVGNNKMLNTKN